MAVAGPDKRRIGSVCAVLAAAVALSGCETPATDSPLMTAESQVRLRSIQSRAFDTMARQKTLRTVMATLQDLSFIIDDADAEVGTISGTKFGKTKMGRHYALRMTVSVRLRGEKQLLVRANALYGTQAVMEPGPYQDFFAALQKTMFLDAHLIAPAPQQKKVVLQKIDARKKIR